MDVDVDFEGQMSRRGCPIQQDALTVDGIAEEVGEDAEETQIPRSALGFIGSLRVVVVRMLRCVSGESAGPPAAGGTRNSHRRDLRRIPPTQELGSVTARDLAPPSAVRSHDHATRVLHPIRTTRRVTPSVDPHPHTALHAEGNTSRRPGEHVTYRVPRGCSARSMPDHNTPR